MYVCLPLNNTSPVLCQYTTDKSQVTHRSFSLVHLSMCSDSSLVEELEVGQRLDSLAGAIGHAFTFADGDHRRAEVSEAGLDAASSSLKLELGGQVAQEQLLTCLNKVVSPLHLHLVFL